MDIPELVLAGPDSIAASIPYILGFTPGDSLVVLWLREGCVRLTMRIDLPPAHAAPHEWVDAVMAHHLGSDEIILAVFPARKLNARDARGVLRAESLVALLLEQLASRGCRVHDALLVQGDRWWSYLCEQPECCSSAGTVIDPAIADDVAARFALAGVAPLPDRDAVLACCAANPARQKANRPRVLAARRAYARRDAAARATAAEFERMRDQAIEFVRDALLGTQALDDAREAEILVALGDVRVRDTVLWEIAHSRDHDGHRAFDRAAHLLRGAPSGTIAPIGSVAALLAWLIGDGVRAGAALDRVRAERADYPLAELLARSIGAGLSPTSWLEMMSRLDRRACRGPREPELPAA
ncbi:MAG: hypothetical protein RL205_1563 [Actinomycetota bacterium]